jgi:hypothetical protein
MIHTFHMFSDISAKLFISSKVVTTLLFPDPIDMYVGGWNPGEVMSKKTANMKTLIIKPVEGQCRRSNLVVTSGEDVFQFDIYCDDKRPHKAVRVVFGAESNSFSLLEENMLYDAYEGDHTIQILTKAKISINAKEYPKGVKVELPKGIPIFINKERRIY